MKEINGKYTYNYWSIRSKDPNRNIEAKKLSLFNSTNLTSYNNEYIRQSGQAITWQNKKDFYLHWDRQ